jgi:hypothetical protein
MEEAIENSSVLRDVRYKELDFYEEQDANLFAGRDRDIDNVVARVTTQRVLVLYGRSGFGKTSLLLAGVIPRLQRVAPRRKYRPLYVRVLGADPLADLEDALSNAFSIPRKSLLETLRLIQETQESIPIIVIDQFEEFFIRFAIGSNSRERYTAALATAIGDETIELKVIFSVREDFLAALDGFQSALPDLFTNAYRLGPLSSLGAREAILRPLRLARVSWDPELINKLVEELERFNFDSARLQVTCVELLREAYSKGERRHLSIVDLQNLFQDLSRHTRKMADPQSASDGAPTPLLLGVIQRYVHRLLDPLSSRWSMFLCIVLEALLTSEDTKRAVSLRTMQKDILCEPNALNALIRELVEQRIIRETCTAEGPWYELRHECLAPEVRNWISLNPQYDAFLRLKWTIQKSTELWLENEGNLVGLSKDQWQLLDSTLNYWQPSVTEAQFLFCSAVESRYPPAVAKWSSKVDIADIHRLVVAFLRSPSPESRSSGAIALGSIRDASAETIELLKTLASSPLEPDIVRQESMRALVHLLASSDLRRFANQLHFLDTSTPVEDFYATIAENGRLEHVNWLTRFRARRAIRRRTIARSFGQEAGQTLSDLAYGACLALLWCVTSALLTLSMVVPRLGSIRDIPGALFLLGLAAVIAGPFLSWRVTCRARRAAALSGSGWRSQFKALAGSKSMGVTIYLAFLLSYVLSLDYGDNTSFDTVQPSSNWLIACGGILLVAGVGSCSVAALGIGLARLLPQGVSRRKVILFALAAAAAAAAAVQLAASEAASHEWFNGRLHRANFAFFFGASADLIASCCIIIFVTSIVRGFSFDRKASQSRLTGLVGFVLIVVLGIAAFVMFCRLYELSTSPIVATITEDGVSVPIAPQFSAWPQSIHYEINGGRGLLKFSMGDDRLLNWVQLSTPATPIRLGGAKYQLSQETLGLQFSNLSIHQPNVTQLLIERINTADCTNTIEIKRDLILLVCPIIWSSSNDSDNRGYVHIEAQVTGPAQSEPILSVPSLPFIKTGEQFTVQDADGGKIPDTMQAALLEPRVLFAPNPFGNPDLRMKMHTEIGTRLWKIDLRFTPQKRGDQRQTFYFVGSLELAVKRTEYEPANEPTR